MKKKIAFLLIIAILASLFQIVSSAVHYTDVSSSYAYFDSVNYVSDNSLMSAIGGNSFGVSNNVTRAMVMIVLYKYEGSPNKFSPNPFSDVSSSDVCYNAVRWAVYANITTGTSGATFSPNKNVTRQDLACFLYRYARYKNYDLVNNVLNMNIYYDRNSISNYAYDSVCWAVGKNIIPPYSALTFSPTSYITRGYFADVIVKFGTNSKGIDLHKESFSFVNNTESFFPSNAPNNLPLCYEMMPSISNYLHAIVGSAFGNTARAAVIDMQTDEWIGACFGMTAICALDKLGKIDFDRNFSTASNIYSMNRPVDDMYIKSYIHYYQLLQVVPTIREVIPDESSPMLSELIAGLRESGIAMFLFTHRVYDKDGKKITVGHATLMYDYLKEGDTYVFDAYDPNFPGEEVQIRIPSNGSNVRCCTPYYDIDILKYEFIDDFDCFDIFDIDGTYNNSPMYYSSNRVISNTENVNMPWTNEDVTMLTVPINDDCVITNSNGETIINRSGTLSGTMNIIGYDFTVSDNPMYRILVDKSESYTVVSERNNIDISILEKYKYIGVEAKNAESVMIDGGYINMKGNNINFDSCVYIEECSSEIFKLTGNSDDMRLSLKDNSVKIEADRYFCDVQAYDETDITSEENVYCYSLSSARDIIK